LIETTLDALLQRFDRLLHFAEAFSLFGASSACDYVELIFQFLTEAAATLVRKLMDPVGFRAQ